MAQGRSVGDDDPVVGKRDGADRTVQVRGAAPGFGREDEQHSGADEEQRERGEQAGDAAPIERRQRDGVRLAPLTDEQSGDQEAGEDEEDVYPDVAAAQPVVGGVEDEDEKHGEPAQPVQRGPVAESSGVRRAHAPPPPAGGDR